MLESRMKSSFQQDDLMTILDGIEDAVVKLDGQAKFAAISGLSGSHFGLSGHYRKKSRLTSVLS